MFVVCLSVTFVHRNQATEIFGNVSTPFGCLANGHLWPFRKNFTEIVPGEPLRRGLNAGQSGPCRLQLQPLNISWNTVTEPALAASPAADQLQTRQSYFLQQPCPVIIGNRTTWTLLSLLAVSLLLLRDFGTLFHWTVELLRPLTHLRSVSRYFSLIRHNRTVARASVLWRDINWLIDWLIDWGVAKI